MFDHEKVSARIKAIRGSMSQRAFAKKMNCGQVYVSEIETSKTKPSIEFLINLSDEFGPSIDFILRGQKSFNLSESEQKVLCELLKTVNTHQKTIEKAFQMIGEKVLF